jgi:hypothetical protein
MNAAEYDQALARERVVRDNLANRLGLLMAENIELLVRIHELETAHQEQQQQQEETSAP